MFRTHTPGKNSQTSYRWFAVNSFNDSTVSPRQNLQSTKTNSELKTINKVERNDARCVSEGFGELITDFKFSGKSNNSDSEQKVEVLNKRYDLSKLQKK